MQNTLAYRGAMILWVLGNLVSVFTITAVWLSSSGQNTLGGYTRPQLIAYYLFVLILNWLVIWHAAHYVKEEIKDGSIGQTVLTKPISYFFQNMAKELGWHTVSPLAGMIGLGIAFFFLRTHIQINISLENALFLIPTIFLGGIICYAISLCLGLLAFWLTETDALHGILWAGLFLAGGQGIPLSFFPVEVRHVLEFLPFSYIYSFPLEIFSGRLTAVEIISGIIKQLIWIALLVLLYKFMWKKGTKAYQSYGG